MSKSILTQLDHRIDLDIKVNDPPQALILGHIFRDAIATAMGLKEQTMPPIRTITFRNIPLIKSPLVPRNCIVFVYEDRAESFELKDGKLARRESTAKSFDKGNLQDSHRI